MFNVVGLGYCNEEERDVVSFKVICCVVNGKVESILDNVSWKIKICYDIVIKFFVIKLISFCFMVNGFYKRRLINEVNLV